MWIGIVVAALIVVLVFSYRYAWWASPVYYSRPRVLMFHMIADLRPGEKNRGLRVPPAMFERQLEWLKAEGWTFVTMAELINRQANLPEKTVAITFDDGYEDNHTTAFPLLRKYDAKATLYLVVDRHDRDWAVYKKAHHDSGELARVPKLSDAQVREMVESGVFELGAHTLTHANLASIDDEAREREIAGSKTALGEKFGCEVTSFAYPFGIYSSRDVDAVRAAGFTNAVTTEPSIDAIPFERPLEISRVKISGKEGMFSFKIRMKTGKRGVAK